MGQNSGSDIKRKLSSSTLWMSLSASGLSLISFAIFIVLSRILSVTEIGVMGFALLLVETGKLLVNAGFTQALVQREHWDQAYASSCFFIGMAIALALSLLNLGLIAPLVAQYYALEAGPVLASLTAIFILEAVKTVQDAKLRREFRFKSIALRTICSNLSAGALGVYLALTGAGIWALVWQQLLSHLLMSLISLSSARWVPSFTLAWGQLRQLFQFSLPLMFAQLVAYLCTSLLEFFVGIFLGPAALGLYRVAGRALFILQDIVLKPFEHTALAALSRLEQASIRAQAALRMMRVSSYLAFPVFFGTAAIAPDFIQLLFGSKWLESGQLMVVLALGTAPMAITYQLQAALSAQDKTTWVMWIAWASLISSALIGVSLCRYSLEATAWGFLARNYLLVLFTLVLFARAFNCSLARCFTLLMPSLAGACLMLALLTAAKYWLPPQHPALRILELCLLGGLSYIAVMYSLMRAETRNFLQELAPLAPSRFRPLLERLQLWAS